MTTCTQCGGTKHLRTETGWTRCPCLDATLARDYVAPAIRGGRLTLPEEYATYRPYPLTDLTVGGSGRLAGTDLGDFKGMVWHSLLTHRPPDLVYEYMDAYRLVDIYFQRDKSTPAYDSVRELVPMDLLILHLGVTDVPNKLMAPLLIQLLNLRREIAKPTWIFTVLQLPRIREVFSNDLADLLAPVLPVIGAYRAP